LSRNFVAEALAEHNAGRLDKAQELYRAAIANDPDDVNAWYLLGVALLGAGRAQEALGALDAALRIAPDAAEPLYNRALARLALGRSDAAEADLRRAVASRPDIAEAQALLGRLVRERGLPGEAVPRLEAALAAAPGHKGAAVDLGLALQELGRTSDAIVAFRRASALVPDNADVWRCLAGLLTETGGGAEAAAAAKRATALDPGNAAAWYVEGAARQTVTDLDGATDALERAVALAPDYVDAAIRLAHLKANRCDWRDGGLAARHLVELSQRLPVWPWAVATLPSSAAEQRRAAEIWARAKTRQDAPPRPPRRRAPGERLRIGYLSADFHQHATAFLIAEVLEKHDRNRVEIVGYSLGPDDGSAMRRRLAAAFERFVDLATETDDAAAAQIATDDLDILVDLKGWTQNARPAILAARPAPLQIAWLGYPGAMGADWIDYVLADRIVLPPALAPHFSEAAIGLPDSYQPNDARRVVAPRTPPRASHGLPDRGFVFCCFNNVYKIQPATFDVWMRLLAGVPGSVLWLLSPYDFPKPHLRREAEARGIDPARLVFAEALAQDEHLARLALADLFLDTLPVNAHTTASDALWMGLPVVTCAGETFAGRVAASLTAAAGVPELAVGDLAAYEAMALRLAREPEALSAIRTRLAVARKTSPLFDAGRFARHLEDAFAFAVARADRGLPPARFDVPPRS